MLLNSFKGQPEPIGEGRLAEAGLGTKEVKVLTDADVDRVRVFMGHGSRALLRARGP